MDAPSQRQPTSRGLPLLHGVPVPPWVFGGAVAVVGSSPPVIDLTDPTLTDPTPAPTLLEVDLRVAA